MLLPTNVSAPNDTLNVLANEDVSCQHCGWKGKKADIIINWEDERLHCPSCKLMMC